MIDFYFDFISPYGYFAAMQIDKLAAKYNCNVEWHSMLLGVSVIKIMGLKPLLETPLKGEYVLKDIARLASIYNIPLTPPTNVSPNPVLPARAFYWVQNLAHEKSGEFAKLVYCAQWQEDLDISNPEVLAKLVQSIGLDGNDLLVALNTADLSDRVRKKVDGSISRGIFGSPTFIVDEQMIWGCDRLWMLEHWLANGSWSNTN